MDKLLKNDYISEKDACLMEPVSLIFLVHNEAETIEREIRSFNEKIIKKLPGSEFIVAEDGSTDGTSDIIKSLEKEAGIIHLTSKKRKGYIKALVDAVKFSKNEYIFISDTGFKHNPDDFWNIYNFRKKYDLVVGRKTKRKDQLYRKLFTYIYNLLLRIYFGFNDLYDADSGFRLFNRKIGREVICKRLIFTDLIGSEIVLRSRLKGFKYSEVPVSYNPRSGSSRGLPLEKIPRVILKVLKDIRLLKREFV